MSEEKSAVVSDDGPELTRSDLLDIRKRMRFHLAMGIAGYPRDRNLELFLERSSSAILSRSPASFPEGPGKTVGAMGWVDNVVADASTLPALAEEIGQCTRCHLGAGRRGTVVGQGRPGARLMVVGDWSAQEDGFSGGQLFGPGEDDMLWKMIAAIELDRKDVYVTNCIKCCPGGDNRPDGEAEKSCFSYLEREIAAVRPQILCAMGDTAARVLLGSKVPLIRLRGKPGSYRYQSAGPITVMPTFHPRFLLGSPEMKKATWNDLLMIRRFLSEGRS